MVSTEVRCQRYPETLSLPVSVGGTVRIQDSHGALGADHRRDVYRAAVGEGERVRQRTGVGAVAERRVVKLADVLTDEVFGLLEGGCRSFDEHSRKSVVGADPIGNIPVVGTHEARGRPRCRRHRRDLTLGSSVRRIRGDLGAGDAGDEVIAHPRPHQDARHIGEHPRNGLSSHAVHEARESAAEPSTRFSFAVTVLGRISSSRATSALLMSSQ